MNQKTRLIFAGLMLLFILTRLPGLGLPYHQDEWKYVAMTETEWTLAGGGITAHPPLTSIFFRVGAMIFGSSHLRFLPLVFSILSAILLYLVARRRFGERAAQFSLFLYAIAVYSVLASLMIDTDGALLPFLFLAVVYCYDRAFDQAGGRRALWLGSLALLLFLGLMVKLSFILVVGMVAVDFLFSHWRSLNRRQVILVSLNVVGFVAISLLALILWRKLSPSASNANDLINHVRYFIGFGGRNYLQIIVEGIKALFYLSPLLLFPLVYLKREMIIVARPFLIYLGLGFIFYFILFDFSRGALDKYLMFTIVPLAMISGAALARAWLPTAKLSLSGLVFLLIASADLFLLQFLSPVVLPLYPKTVWFARVLAGHWNMLMPFTGGSGPLGFYVSFLLIAVAFILALILALIGRFNLKWRNYAVLGLMIIGIIYNGVFIEELLFGHINGQAPALLQSALAYLGGHQEIKSVITYNDIGAYELSQLDKYVGRFYATPEFETGHQKRFAEHNRTSGYYLVIEMPALYQGFYTDFFATCRRVFEDRSGVIAAHVYSCRA